MTTPTPAPADENIFDLDAALAEARAANPRAPFRFRYGGEVFTMRAPEECDWLAAAAWDGGDAQPLIIEMLGEDYRRFANQRVPAKAVNRLFMEALKYYGTTPGESPASLPS